MPDILKYGFNPMPSSDLNHPSCLERLLKRPFYVLKMCFHFFKAWIKNPRNIGAIAPSSNLLGQAIASEINLDKPGFIIELGGGTGALTKALLNSGIDPKRLIVIEQNLNFVKLLKQQFTQSLILEADAQNLAQVLKDQKITEINAIVSGIPLRSLPKRVLINIIKNSLSLLSIDSSFIQFTYGVRSPIPLKLVHENPSLFSIKVSNRVWGNIPPATVWVYSRIS